MRVRKSVSCFLVAFEVYGNGYNAVVVAADKVEYFFAYGAGLDVVFDASQGVEYRSLGLVYMSVCLGCIVNVFGGEVSTGGHDFGVDAVVYGGVVCQDDVGGHVTADTAAAFDEYPFADIGVFVYDGAGREYGAGVDGDVSGHFDAVAQHAGAYDVAVVSDVSLGHNEAPVAYTCTAFFGDTAVDDDLFADDIVVAYVAVSFLALPTEVLGVGADDGTLVDFVVFAHASTADDACIRHNGASVADDNVFVDVRKGMDGDAFAYFGVGVYVC